jgi:hypothetical protein
MSSDCEIVHICFAWRELSFGVGDFSDPVTGAAGTLFFEPVGASFLLLCRAALADFATTEQLRDDQKFLEQHTNSEGDFLNLPSGSGSYERKDYSFACPPTQH